MRRANAVRPHALRRSARLSGFAGFLLNNIILAGTPLASLPLAIAVAGPGLWVSVALGQSVGNLLGTILSYGWAVSGPAKIAAQTSVERGEFYFSSVRAKILLIVPLLGIAAGTCGLLAPAAWASTLAAWSGLCVGLSAAWYFVGAGQPTQVMVLDTLPRITCTALGLGLSVTAQAIEPFLILQTGGCLVAFGLCTRKIRQDSGATIVWSRILYLRDNADVLRSQIWAAGIGTLGAANSSMPLPLYTLTDPSGAAMFAACQRSQRFVQAVTRALTQSLQSWIPAGPAPGLIDRVRQGFGVAAVSGLAVSVLVAVAVPTFVRTLSLGYFHIGPVVSILIGATVGLAVFSEACGLACLAALGQEARVLRIRIASTAILAGGIPVGAILGGIEGGWSALLVTEVLVAGAVAGTLHRELGLARSR